MSQKTPSYLDAQLANKIQHEDLANAKRVINVDTLVNAYWNRMEPTYGTDGGITSANFYLDTEYQVTKVVTVADVAGSLINKYFLLNSALNSARFYVWFNVDSGGIDPMISGRTGIEVAISSGDSAEVVAAAIRIFINSLASAHFTVTSVENKVTIANKVLGAADPSSDANTGFTISTEILGVSSLLLSKDFTQTEGYKYIYNEFTKSFELVDNCLAVDTANSTDVPLDDGEIFYGPWTRRTCPEIIVAPYADTNFEYYVQFANTELSTTVGFPSYTAGAAGGIDSSLKYDYVSGVTFGTPRRLIAGREWYRVVIRNNSGSDMTTLRVQVSVGDFQKLEVRLNNPLPLDSDALTTRSVQTGLDPNNEYVNERQGGYNESFTVDTALINTQSFDSGILDLSGYSFLLTEIACDVPLTLVGTWYDDIVGTNVIRSFNFPYSGGDLSLTGTTMLSQFLRYQITNNSGSDATYTRLKVRTTNTPYQSQLLPLEAFIPPNVLSSVGRNINVGKNPNGVYVNERQSGYLTASSSNTPLVNGASFESEIVSVEEFSQVIGEFKADQIGIVNGYWYADSAGTQLIRTFTVPYVQNSLGQFELEWFATSTLAPYFQIAFTNSSGVDQTEFHFRFKLETQPQTGQMLKIESFVPSNSIVVLNRSVIVGKRASDSTYQNVGINDKGALQISEFYNDVALGNYTDAIMNVKFGRNPDIGTATTPEDVWNGGGTYTGQPITGTATTLEVVSSSILDTSAGTGARTVRIYGLDADYNEITEVVTLNGTTPVTTVNSYWRQPRAEVLSAGSLGSNQGTITTYWTGTPAQIFMVMPINSNQTSVAADTVPAGKKRLVLGIRVSMARAGGTAGSANARLLIRELGGVFQTKRSTEITESLAYDKTLKGGILVPEKTDIKWQVFSVSDNGTIVTAEYEYIDIEI